ncbi:hypothetical protein ACFZC6_16520 [Streptomyces ossamyceticus]|uniref:hypothetical protein n=1 Tax=Streptomyces ossamyceticus TaxID=249581 RepID=UPI0036EAC0EB
MIAQAEIDEAEAAVEQAEAKLDVAEEYHHQSGGERAVQELRAARFAAHSARDRLRQLRSRWAAERAAEARRAQAEKDFPKKRREALTRQLADARDEAVHAVAALEKAAAEALAAAAAYGVTVREASGELTAAGLRAGDGGEDGGTAAGTAYLGGEVWRPADPGSLLAAVVRAVVAEQDARHPVARWRQVAGLADRAAQAELLETARAAVR